MFARTRRGKLFAADDADDANDGENYSRTECCRQHYILCNMVELPLWAFLLILILLLICLITTGVSIWLALEWPSHHACEVVYRHNTKVFKDMVPTGLSQPIAPDCSICATTAEVPVWITPKAICNLRTELSESTDLITRRFCDDVPPLANEHVKACVTHGELLQLWEQSMCHNTLLAQTPKTWFGIFQEGLPSKVNLGFDGHLFCDAKRSS